MPVVPSLTEFDYILREERDLPPEARAVFRLKPLRFKDREEADRIEFRQGPDGEPILVSDRMKTARKLLNAGLIGWTGVRDSEGKEVVFSRNGKSIPEHLLDIIAPWASELANAISENARITMEQAKNLP